MITRSYWLLTFSRNWVKLLCISNSDGFGGICPRVMMCKLSTSVAWVAVFRSILPARRSDKPLLTSLRKSLFR
ncbi:hypothetical protein D3C84_1157630 [compost metagenome]